MKKSNKNVSKTIKNGTRIQTRDEYLGKTDYSSPGHENKRDLYRGAYVVDSNKNDELVLVKLTTHNGKSPKGTISEYVKVFDKNGNPIKIDNLHFVVKNKKSLSKHETTELKKKIFKTSSRANKNRSIVRKHIKKRQKKMRDECLSTTTGFSRDSKNFFLH